jgi:hypothetical protein
MQQSSRAQLTGTGLGAPRIDGLFQILSTSLPDRAAEAPVDTKKPCVSGALTKWAVLGSNQ